MRALVRCLIAAVWALLFLFLGGCFIELGTSRHGNYEYYGTYVVLPWPIGIVGAIAILAVRRRPGGRSAAGRKGNILLEPAGGTYPKAEFHPIE